MLGSSLRRTSLRSAEGTKQKCCAPLSATTARRTADRRISTAPFAALRRRHTRAFSSVDRSTTAEADAATAVRSKIEPMLVENPPRPLFPWRHEPAENLLPRLQFQSPEYKADVTLPNDIQSMLAVLFLRVPFWRVFFGTSWRDELAEAGAYAFARGVSGIVANIYQLPFCTVSVGNDGSAIEFQYPASDNASHVKDKQEGSSNGKSEGDEGSATSGGPSPRPTSVEDDRENAPDVTHMLDRPLRRLFQAAHESGRDQLLVTLKSEPQRAMLYTLFGVPFLTRARAEADTGLLNRVRDLLALSRDDSDTAFNGINDIIKQQAVERREKIETTLEMQILVECKEQFQVRDRQTGALLQGDEDGLARTVMHLVRFETNVTWRGKFPSAPVRTQDDWIITDIDDLVGSKKWYHKH